MALSRRRFQRGSVRWKSKVTGPFRWERRRQPQPQMPSRRKDDGSSAGRSGWKKTAKVNSAKVDLPKAAI
jgi:hypothetical protein